MNNAWRVVIAFIFALVPDLVTKTFAENFILSNDSIPVLGQILRLTLNFNTGVAFGLFTNQGVWPLMITGGMVAGLCGWMFSAIRSGRLPQTMNVPMGLILGGALGNFIDRLPDRRVTDFLDVGLGASRLPTFNLADSSIVVGLAILLLLSFRKENLLGTPQ